ncbi:MAG TPA: trehalose-phosphatase [Actinomycetota bacterium]|nr:trehalose-phosphatase [Actinomycetota bacterium]
MSGDALRELAAAPERAGILLDFDGSLSEIAPTPDAARAIDGAAETLTALARRFRTVAVISGRRAAEVAQRLAGATGVRIFGLYGLEDERGPVSADAADRMEAAARALPDIERAAAFVPGTLVEPKGLQVAVHYRGSADPEHARRILVARLSAVARERGFEVLEGRRVVEVAPPGAPSKGAVVASLAGDERLDPVLYAGDDLADLDAFGAVAARGGVRVAVRSAESPPQLLAEADLVVDGPAGLLELLRGLLR